MTEKNYKSLFFDNYTESCSQMTSCCLSSWSSINYLTNQMDMVSWLIQKCQAIELIVPFGEHVDYTYECNLKNISTRVHIIWLANKYFLIFRKYLIYLPKLQIYKDTSSLSKFCIYINLAFLNCDRKPIKPGNIVRYCWGTLN